MGFKKVFVFLAALMISVVLFFAFPLLLIWICLTFGTYFYFVKISAKLFKPTFGKILNLSSQMFTADLKYTDNRGTIVSGFVIEGNLDIDKWKDTITRNVLKGVFPNGELKYPEMKQYQKYWMGYHFWKDDKTFDLNRHVTVYKPNSSGVYTDTDVQDIYNELAMKPWTKKKPIWEFVLVPNYYSKEVGGATNCSVMFLRFHHSLGDAYSFFKLFNLELSDLKAIPKNALPTYPKATFLESFVFFITFPFRLAYEHGEVLAHILFRGNEFVPLDDIREKYHVAMADKIQVQQIKEIKDHFKVSFASVVNAGVAGGIRDFFNSKGQKFYDFMIQGGTLPLPGHPDKLRIYLAGGKFLLPIGEADPIKRLTFCFEDYKSIRYSTIAAVSRFTMVLSGVIPAGLVKPFMGRTFLTFGNTIFPAGMQHMYFQGYKCVDIFAVSGIGPLGLALCSISYADGLRISMMCKNSVMTKEESKKLMELVKDNFDILRDRMILDV